MRDNVLREIMRVFGGLKSEATARGYRSALKVLAEWFEVEWDSLEFESAIKALSVQSCMSFVLWMKNRPGQLETKAADETVRLRIVLLRRLFRHFAAVEFVTKNPFDAVSDSIPLRRKRQKRPTKMIPFDRVVQIIEAPSAVTRDGIRDRALLALLFGGGLRRSEVAKLNIDDIRTTADGVPYLLIREAKSGSDQEQALPEWAWERFSILVSQRKSEGAVEGEPLFVFYYDDGRARGRLSVETIRRMYRNYCAALGVAGASPHSARSTAASFLDKAGYTARQIADFLRHSTTQSVDTYIKNIRGPAESCAPSVVYPRKVA